jgi:hypothetical protein
MNITKGIVTLYLIQFFNQTKFFFFHLQVIKVLFNSKLHNQYLEFYF